MAIPQEQALATVVISKLMIHVTKNLIILLSINQNFPVVVTSIGN